MIQEFQVSNFYSIREKVSLNFLPSSDDKMLDYYTHEVKPGLRLLKIGIIYGANASGKTTVLEAISFFRNFMVKRPDDKLKGMGFSPFMLDNDSRSRNTFMEMTFFIDGEKYIASAEFNEQIVVSEQLTVYTSSRPTQLYKRTYSEETGHSTIKDFCTKHSREVPVLSDAAKIRLYTYSWPNNYRELKQVVESAVMDCKDGVITEKEINFVVNTEDLPTDKKSLIIYYLRLFNGNKTKTAQALRKSRPTLDAWLNELGINADDYKLKSPAKKAIKKKK